MASTLAPDIAISNVGALVPKSWLSIGEFIIITGLSISYFTKNASPLTTQKPYIYPDTYGFFGIWLRLRFELKY